MRTAALLATALALAFATTADAGPHRLPAGYRWGRCLLVVEGETRISGRCSYWMEPDGSFGINGPKQVYGGIDYPTPQGGADERSQDWWAVVWLNEDVPFGYANADIGATHGGRSYDLKRRGTCWEAEGFKACLWTA